MGIEAWRMTREVCHGVHRLARMVQHPAVADVSKALWSFASPSQVFLEKLPQLMGVPFGELALRFADGTVLGLLNRRSGQCDIAPPANTLVCAAAAALLCFQAPTTAFGLEVAR